MRADLCSGTRLRPCSRWKLCPKCNDLQARRTSARIYRTLEILEEEELPVFALTITLPGAWHGIRHSSIFSQYAYATARSTVQGLAGQWPMRGLNKRLKDAGVVGGWHFVECTYNSAASWWNVHVHSILLGDCTGWLPKSEVEIDENFSRKIRSSTSDELRTLGFGERYTLDECQDQQQVVGYCVALAYSSKQALKGTGETTPGFSASC